MSLFGRDEKKLIAAGFTLIRRDDQPSPRIKYKGKDHTNKTGSCFEWRTLGNSYPTKAARDRAADELLKLSTFIEC